MFDIIILGAGISGTSAALQVIDRSGNTLKIAIIEAQNHIGGRAACVESFGDSRRYPSAATYLHDVNQNCLFKFFPQFSGVLDESKSCSLGSTFDQFVSISREGKELPLASMFSPYEEPYYFQQKVMSAIDYGTDVDRVNLKLENDRPLGPEGEHEMFSDRFLFKGFQPLLDTIEQQIHAQPNIQLFMGTKVTQVNKEQDGTFTISTLCLTTGETQRIQSKYLIMTLPVGVLQSGNIEFSEDFRPMRKQLTNFNSGFLSRAILKFEDMSWDNSKSVWMLDIDGGVLRVNNYSKFAEEKDSNVLLATLTVTESEYEALYKDQAFTKETITNAIKQKILTKNKEQKCFVDLHNWGGSEFCLGGFSTISQATSGLYGCVADVYEDLNTVLPNGCILAGEYMSLEYNGSVHGAAKTGVEAGSLAVDLLNKSHFNIEREKLLWSWTKSLLLEQKPEIQEGSRALVLYEKPKL